MSKEKKIRLSKHQKEIITLMRKGVFYWKAIRRIKTKLILEKLEIIDNKGDLTEIGKTIDLNN